jgi:hypothetical protein
MRGATTWSNHAEPAHFTTHAEDHQSRSSQPRLLHWSRNVRLAHERPDRRFSTADNSQFCSVQISKFFLSSSDISIPFSATPCKTLCIFRFVMSNMAGCPSGTNHLTSTPDNFHNRMNACRISATPPPDHQRRFKGWLGGHTLRCSREVVDRYLLLLEVIY